MHMAKGTIVSLFTVFSAYISSVQCREATSGNRVEEADVDPGGGDHIYIYIYDAGLLHPPSPPPPHGIPPPACQVGSRLVWPCCFPVFLGGLVWPRPLPPYGVGPVVFLVGPACVLRWGLGSFWLAPPRLCGAACSTEVWYGCCSLLAAMSSLRARYHTTFLLANGAPIPALMRFSADLPPSGLCGFVPVVRDRWTDTIGRGGGVARDPRAHMYVYMYMCVYVYVCVLIYVYVHIYIYMRIYGCVYIYI